MTDKTERIRITPTEKALIEQIRYQSNSTSDCEPEIIYEYRTYNEGDLYFVLPDAHYPYQNEPLMQKVFQAISDTAPKGVVISGDWLDLYTLGSYNAESLKNLRNVDLTQEYMAGLKGIEDLEKVLPTDARRCFLWGNHEDRYFREISKKDNSKYGGRTTAP